MTEWIISSSVLIVIVISLRALLKGRISLRLQYGLWTLVLVRLLIPFSLPGTDLSVINAVPQQAVSQAEENLQKPIGYVGYDQSALPVRPTPVPGQEYQQVLKDWEAETESIMAQTGTPVTLSSILTVLWLTGAAATALAFLISNLRFGRKLRTSRDSFTVNGSALPTYRSDYVATPCLYGLFRPSIYLTGEVCDNDRLHGHVLAHEQTHYRHLDHIWSFLRCVCLVAHWYNPLVWVAAILSKQDAELACDEATIHFLGEEQRTDYGRTLVSMTCIKQDAKDLLLTATTMNSGKKELKERIKLIARNPKTAVITLIVVILVCFLSVGYTFTGSGYDPAAPTKPGTAETTAPDETTPGTQEVNVAAYGLTFSLPDELAERMLVEETGTVYSGSTELYRFREKSSVEQWIADFGEDDGYVGGLYILEVQTQAQFDAHDLSKGNGEYFARDEEKSLYYGFTFFGGPQDYRTGGDGSHWTDENWRAMYESMRTSYTTLAEQIIQNEGLTPFTNTDLKE